VVLDTATRIAWRSYGSRSGRVDVHVDASGHPRRHRPTRTQRDVAAFIRHDMNAAVGLPMVALRAGACAELPVSPPYAGDGRLPGLAIGDASAACVPRRRPRSTRLLAQGALPGRITDVLPSRDAPGAHRRPETGRPRTAPRPTSPAPRAWR
jgi:hypothetical protein